MRGRELLVLVLCPSLVPLTEAERFVAVFFNRATVQSDAEREVRD